VGARVRAGGPGAQHAGYLLAVQCRHLILPDARQEGGLLPREIAVNRLGGAVAHAYGLNRAARAGSRVPASEDPRDARGASVRVAGNGPGARHLDRGRQKGQVGRLADSQDDRIRGDDSVGALYRDGPAAAGGVRLAEAHRDDFDARHMLVFPQDAHRVGQQQERHALGFGLVNLESVGRHLGARAPVGDGRLGAQPERATGGINGSVAAAHYDDPPADVRTLARVHRTQKVDCRLDARQILAGNAQARRFVGADGEVHGVVFGAQGFQARHRAVSDDADAQRLDARDLLVEHALRQAVVGDAIAEHATRLGARLEHCHCVAEHGQVLCCGQATGPGADDGHALLAGNEHGLYGPVAVFGGPVGHEALQRGDGD